MDLQKEKQKDLKMGTLKGFDWETGTEIKMDFLMEIGMVIGKGKQKKKEIERQRETGTMTEKD